MDEAVGTRIVNVIITKHELTDEQRIEINGLLLEVIRDFAAKVDNQNEEQLYYVESPIQGYGVLNRNNHNSRLSWNGTGQYGDIQTQFTQKELGEIQEVNPAMNIKMLQVRVEDFGNGQDN